MKRFSSKLSAVFLSACMLLPTLSIGFPINYEISALAAETEANSILFNNEDQFFVYVGTYSGGIPQFRYLYPTSDGSYNADKVIWENAPAGLAYGDIFVAEGDVPMTQVYPAKDDPANAHVYYYTLDEGAKLNKAGNCPDLMEKKDMSVTSKTYDGSSHWSIRYMDAAGKEYYYGLSTFASSLGVDPLDCEVGNVYTYALYNDHMVVPLAKQTETITDTMKVEVVEVHEKYLLVKPTDRLNSNERLTLSTKYLDSEVEPSVGMKLEVTYTDGILETYPEEFGNVKKVSVVSDDTVASGDVNNDGAFNVSDVLLLQKWLLAVPDMNLANWKAVDFCKDNKLDVFDLCLMKRALLENIPNPVEPPADHIAPLGFKNADDAIKEIIQSDFSEIEGYAQMFERFRNDGFIYHFTDVENAITLREDRPNAAVWLMPYYYFEDTGILYHVVYQGKDYQVYYYFTDPAFPASDLWDYMEQRLHTDQVKVVDGKYGIVHHPNGGQPVVSAYFAIDDTHYCKVKTFEQEDALMDFLQVLNYEKLDIADNREVFVPVNSSDTDLDKSAIAGKIFAYEKEGAGGYCTLSFNENGRFLYSLGKMSSYMGGGDWKIDGDIVSLIGMVDKTIYLKITDDTLVYIAEGSDEFPYMDIKDGEKFGIYRPEISSDKFQLNSRYSEYGLGNPKIELDLIASELPEFCYVENVRLYDEDDNFIGTMSPAMDADVWSYLVDCHVTEECSKTYYTLSKIRCGEKTYLDDVRSEITVNFKATPAP